MLGGPLVGRVRIGMDEDDGERLGAPHGAGAHVDLGLEVGHDGGALQQRDDVVAEAVVRRRHQVAQRRPQRLGSGQAGKGGRHTRQGMQEMATVAECGHRARR